jgi:hypothetical protein
MSSKSSTWVHCQFRLKRNAELANHDYIERGLKSAGDFGCNRDATTRKP